MLRCWFLCHGDKIKVKSDCNAQLKYATVLKCSRYRSATVPTAPQTNRSFSCCLSSWTVFSSKDMKRKKIINAKTVMTGRLEFNATLTWRGRRTHSRQSVGPEGNEAEACVTFFLISNLAWFLSKTLLTQSENTTTYLKLRNRDIATIVSVTSLDILKSQNWVFLMGIWEENQYFKPKHVFFLNLTRP